jgi:hypothetical protein
VVAVPAPLRNDLYERLADRLRHAEQYAEAARRMANEARSEFSSKDKEVVAMMATVAPGLDERLLNQLRDAEQYAEACRVMVENALKLLNNATEGDDG